MSDYYGPADRTESIATIHAALDADITLLDTGDFYGMGHNELLLNEALQSRNRDAGYNVLTYDLRNHGLSGSANGGIASSGIFEARDVVGSLQYVRSRDETRDMTIGLFSRCLGCSSTFSAMTEFPEAFNDVRCLVGPQPVTMQIILERRLALAGVPANRIEDLEQRIVLRTGIGFARRDPRKWAKHVRVPTFLYQVHDDVLTQPSDVQTMFDNIPIAEKKLQWIYGTTARWDGYLEFQRRPQPMLEWFEKYMS